MMQNIAIPRSLVRLGLALVLAGFCCAATFAQEVASGSRYVAIEPIATNQGTVLDAGIVVDVLGVIDVATELAPSGKLLTFSFQERIYTADFASFAAEQVDQVFATRPVRARTAGDRAELCTTLFIKGSGDVPDLSAVDFQQFLKVEQGGRLVADFSLSLPRNHNSSRRSNTDYCIGGLQFSTDYKVTIQRGLAFTGPSRTVAADIVYYGRTVDRAPLIALSSASHILPLGERSLLPVTTINVSALDVELFRIDPRTLVSFPQLLSNLDGYDARRVDRFYGEKLGQWRVAVASTPNESQSFNVDLGGMIRERVPGLFVAVFSAPELDLRTGQNRPTQWFVHSNIGVTTYSGVEETLVTLAEFDTLDPVAGASIQVLADNNRELFGGFSDAAGTIRIPQAYLAGSGGNAPDLMIVTTERGDFSFVDVSDLKAKPRYLETGIHKAHQEDVYLTVERELFRVGEDVDFYVLAKDLKLDPLADFHLDATLTDPQGKRVGRQSVVTNEHGVATGSFDIKPTYLLGTYQIDMARTDGVMLSSHAIEVSDFVPLTIATTLTPGELPWAASGRHRFGIEAAYFSGGPARGISGDFRSEVRASRTHDADQLDGFVFGPVDRSYRFSTDVQRFTLDDAGQFTGTIDLDRSGTLPPDPPAMYELRIFAAVKDVGGRPNPSSVTVPLDTHASYVGVRAEFAGRLPDGAIPTFSVSRIDRAGAALADVALPYSIVRVRYSYDWYYRDGWRWRRTREDDQTVANGQAVGGRIIPSRPLDWGSYELVVEDVSGFRTVVPFSVGWSSEGRPASEPAQLATSVEVVGANTGVLRASLPFAGMLRVLVAHSDVISGEVARVAKGEVEIPLDLPDHLEPGFHVLVTLLRAVEVGTEHLPQIALGSAWVPSLTAERDVGLSVDVPQIVRSTDSISVAVNTSAQTGSAVLYLVDEGIHAVTGFQNDDPQRFFHGERELPVGVVSNHGRLIGQDHALQAYRVGGGEVAEAPPASGLPVKSSFFKTVAVASPILPIRDGSVVYEFDQPDFEGRLRLVALVASEQGIGFHERAVQVRDPVSLDISLPRFVGTGDQVDAKLALRANQAPAQVRLEERVGSAVDATDIALAEGESVQSTLRLSSPTAGVLPVAVTATFGQMRVVRDFALTARPPSYPHTVLRSVSLSPAVWFLPGRTDVPALTLDEFSLAEQSDLEYRVTVSTTPGVALHQILAALDRYPYGCIEQVASATRGLIFREQLRGDRHGSARDRIGQGIERIIAKQKSSGAFGYWDKFGTVRERFQPYAVETLTLALPYAQDQGRVTSAIRNGLEYLHRRTPTEISTKIYSYGLLARAGYEVTSRARYSIDHELLDGLDGAANDPRAMIDRISLAYWLADILNDERRVGRLHAALEELLAGRPAVQEVLRERNGWSESASLFAGDGNHWRYTARQSASFLAQVSAARQTPLTVSLVQDTGAYLSALRYRSTFLNSKLAQMVLGTTASLTGVDLQVDDREHRIAEDGSIDFAPHLLQSGFRVRNGSRQRLYLNVEIVGPRQTVAAIDNGFKITKAWYDSAGNRVDLSHTALRADQGDIFTVVLEVVATKRGLAGELMLTDLLPSGFEIESAPVVAPYQVDLRAGKRPEFIQNMDDRFVAHFAGSWRRDRRSTVSYTVRAVYPGEMVIPDAHIEFMYQPEIYGRSTVQHGQIVAQ